MIPMLRVDVVLKKKIPIERSKSRKFFISQLLNYDHDFCSFIMWCNFMYGLLLELVSLVSYLIGRIQNTEPTLNKWV